MKILCIHRAHRYSPGSVERDAQIIATVAELLAQMGHEVESCEETDIATIESALNCDVVVSMARSREALMALQQLEQRGVRVVNSPSLLMTRNRATLTALFQENRVTIPESEVVSHPSESRVAFPFWVKQGGAGAETADDVVFVASADDLQIRKFPIGEYLVVAHVAGDLLKFYGVLGTPFLYYYYPTSNAENFSKFGLERINGAPAYYPFKVEQFRLMVSKAGEVSGFEIFGGDCIVASDGTIYLIDFNDFPSFGACRDEAAVAICKLILNYGRESESDV